MRLDRLIRTGIATGVVALALAACNQHKATTPELQTTTGVQPRSEAMTVSGCLRSGMAEDTLVLAASQTRGAGETATFQLTGPERLNLRSYVGQKVEVSGTLRAEEAVTSRGEATEQKAAKGTSGTPVVETKSQVEIKQLVVSSVKPIADRCD